MSRSLWAIGLTYRGGAARHRQGARRALDSGDMVTRMLLPAPSGPLDGRNPHARDGRTRRPIGRTATGLLTALTIALACPAPALAAASPLPPLGSPTAPVEIVEWGDFQCPHCAAFVRETQPALDREYFATGVARLEWRDFANHGPESIDAAVAARAAARQGAFWPYHDYLFAHQYWENSGYWTRAFFLRAAQTLHLDVPRFAADFEDASLRDAVKAESAEARREAPAGTPTFFVDGQAVIGARSADVFRQAIAAALAKAHPAAAPAKPRPATAPAKPRPATAPAKTRPGTAPARSPKAGPAATPAHPITRPAHRPRPAAAAHHPHPAPPHRPSEPHAPARPTPAPDAPRASGT